MWAAAMVIAVNKALDKADAARSAATAPLPFTPPFSSRLWGHVAVPAPARRCVKAVGVSGQQHGMVCLDKNLEVGGGEEGGEMCLRGAVSRPHPTPCSLRSGHPPRQAVVRHRVGARGGGACGQARLGRCGLLHDQQGPLAEEARAGELRQAGRRGEARPAARLPQPPAHREPGAMRMTRMGWG